MQRLTNLTAGARRPAEEAREGGGRRPGGSDLSGSWAKLEDVVHRPADPFDVRCACHEAARKWQRATGGPRIWRAARSMRISAAPGVGHAAAVAARCAL